MSVSDISPKVRYLLWAKSAGRCEFDGCNEPLWRDSLTKMEVNFADVAHIIGDSSNGPRGDIVLSKTYCDDVTNLMLMCKKHHHMIDQITKTYSDDVLRQMKSTHEERVETLTAITPDKTSHVIIYRGRVGQFQPKMDFRDAWLAMYPNWYPANPLPTELGMSNSSFNDSEDAYWNLEVTNLERQFATKVQPYLLSDRERNHFSVFAFAPQPLLIKLGTLIPDLFPVEVYQLHREPPDWKWQPGPEAFEYIVKEPTSKHAVVALNLSLTSTVDSQRIKQVLGGQQYSEWQLTVPNPDKDFLRSREQLQLFRQQFRSLLDAIKFKHGENAVIHIFSVVPVSVAVEIGRVRQPKADLPFVIYDQNNKTNRFLHALNIGG